MSLVRFASKCDFCGKRSEEYTEWPTCSVCMLHTCPNCMLEDSFVEKESGDTCICLECKSK